MGFVDIVVLVVIAAILGLAGWYVYRAKKNGRKCIGCPDSGCDGCAGCSCGCGKSE
jgi:hypothetical protein